MLAIGNAIGIPFQRVAGGGFSGLFDQFGYPAFGASMRLLGTNYTGGLVRVRAFDGASDKGTADVMPYDDGSGEQFVSLSSTITNLDATATGRGLTDSDTLGDLLSSGASNYDGFVTTWYDQSGNGNDASQATAASQPQIASAGNLIMENGKPSVSFDGTDDKLLTSSNLSNNTNPACFFFAGKTRTFPSAIFGKESGVNRGLGFFIENSRYRVSREGFGSNNHDPSVSTDQALLSFILINGVSNFFENNVSIDNPQNILEGLTFDGDSRAIGSNISNMYYDGVMQDFVLYHNDKSSDRTNIQDNINNAFSIY